MQTYLRWFVGLVVGLTFAALHGASQAAVAAGSPPATPAPQPTAYVESSDARLEVPSLPDDPTQVDRGRVVYYYHCMPCHGDRGQGLTAEFRSIWVEDHQNCWASGCHSGRYGDEGFPLPRVIPALVSPERLDRFPTAETLTSFLHETHPPQRPGALTVEETWQVSAFILEQNGRLAADDASVLGVGMTADGKTSQPLSGLWVYILTSLGLILALIVQARNHNS